MLRVSCALVSAAASLDEDGQRRLGGRQREAGGSEFAVLHAGRHRFSAKGWGVCLRGDRRRSSEMSHVHRDGSFLSRIKNDRKAQTQLVPKEKKDEQNLEQTASNCDSVPLLCYTPFSFCV